MWDDRKGDIARATLYMDLRYEGGVNASGVVEPDLVATDEPGLIQTTGMNTTGLAYTGLLSILIEWHTLDPPDEREQLRNAIVFSFQGNRNPFVDHPEWVSCIYEDGCAQLMETVFADGFESPEQPTR